MSPFEIFDSCVQIVLDTLKKVSASTDRTGVFKMLFVKTCSQ